MIQGTIIRVAGPVVDVQFTAGRLPALQEALTVTAEGTERTMEVMRSCRAPSSLASVGW